MPTTTKQQLTQSEAEKFCQLPLTGLTRAYPNHITHLLNSDNDAKTPKQLHPVFYGCFDWHSAVHSFWLLARCAQQFNTLNCTNQIIDLFNTHFTNHNFEIETQYFLANGRKSFERPYGWGWLFELASALHSWQQPEAAHWLTAMQPLLTQVRSMLLDFLPQQHFPIRTGSHSNTAFALILSLEYAQRNDDQPLQDAIKLAAIRYYMNDTNYPSNYEPSGDDFLSAALCSAVLMSKVLQAAEFSRWFTEYLPAEKLDCLLDAIPITNTSDPKICHLVGLNLSRAWCFYYLADDSTAASHLQQRFNQAATKHISMSLPHVINGDFVGEHWLASFVLLAMKPF